MKKQTIIIRDEQARDRVAAFIAGLDLVKPWEVVVGVYRKKRSIPQNKLMHMWFAEIAEDTGDSEAGVKADMKEDFSPRVESKTRPGHYRPMDTSEMNTKQATEFMERVNAWAGSFLGLYLTHPDDQGRNAA